MRVVHFVRWCRRNQPRKYCPPLTRTNIKHTNTSWIRFLRSIQKVVFIRQAQNGLKRSDASTAALKLFGQLDESWATATLFMWKPRRTVGCNLGICLIRCFQGTPEQGKPERRQVGSVPASHISISAQLLIRVNSGLQIAPPKLRIFRRGTWRQFLPKRHVGEVKTANGMKNPQA